MSKQLSVIVGLCWIGSSLAFLVFSLAAGGDAITGKIAGGHFYLGSKGNFSQVSCVTYVLSAFLSAAFGLSAPMFAGAMAWSDSRTSSPKRIFWISFFLFALAFGVALCYSSVHCIVTAMSEA